MVATTPDPNFGELGCPAAPADQPAGCEWDWWPETCGYGHRHIVRVCVRCLNPPPDWDEEPCGPAVGADSEAGRVYESGAAFLARMDELLGMADADGSGVVA